MTRRKAIPKPPPAPDAKGLYALLGVGRDADTAAIRSAYRVRAKRAHPDAGGSAEVFARLKHAHDVLADPVRRKRYDETGDTTETIVNNRRAEVITQIAMVVNAIIGTSVERGVNYLTYDLVNEITKALQSELDKCKKDIAKNKTATTGMEALRGRFTRKRLTSEPNLLAEIVEAHLRGYVQASEGLKGRESLLTECIALVKEYQFRADIQKVQNVYMHFGTGASTGF